MSYQVLARKWRPHSLQEMVGQEHILRMLTNALDSQRLHHAYLFTGTRGVGKTTIARIFAKCLNCEKGITSTPCGTCNTCQAVDAGNFLDLIEIDAASRTKVEDIRELLDNVQYTPTQGRFKVYLIDEVHMLSTHSFNALLKTLEEPPTHIKFLLATTDPKRLPITILSRCLQFNLNHVPVEKISEHLARLCTTENISFEPPALHSIAQAANGSVRDALSLLDQAIAFCGDTLNFADTEQMLGNIEQNTIFRLVDALADRDGKQLLTDIAHLAKQGAHFNQALQDLLSVLHQISVAQIVPDLNPHNERIHAFAKRFSAEDVQLYYQIALIGRRDLPLTPSPQQGFEMTMLRMLAFQPTDTKIPASSNLLPTAKKKITHTPTEQAKKNPEPRSITTQNWAEILPKLELSGMALALASHCTISSLGSDKIVLTLAPQHKLLCNKNLLARIEQALSLYLNKAIQLEVITSTDTLHTPAEQQQQEQITRHTQAKTAIKNDTHVQTIVDLFDATLDVDSIKPIDPIAT